MHWTPDLGGGSFGAMEIPHLLLRRIDPSQNMARFYTLSIEPTLFGDAALVRRWGRIGTGGQQKIELWKTRGEAHAALERLARSKRRRGYEDVD